MSKTKEELNELKKEVEAVNEKCRELTEEELEQVTGGGASVINEHIFVVPGGGFDNPFEHTICE